ncbi:MAG: type II toxin-antitoxin system VapC family toxin [bacterium]
MVESSQAQGAEVIVVDANIVAYFFIQGSFTEKAQALFESQPIWATPRLCSHELLNILATLAKTGRDPLNKILDIWRRAHDLLLPFQQEVDMEKALHIACRLHLSAYDAQYLALADALGVPLITQDHKLIAAAPKVAQSLQGFLRS